MKMQMEMGNGNDWCDRIFYHCHPTTSSESLYMYHRGLTRRDSGEVRRSFSANRFQFGFGLRDQSYIEPIVGLCVAGTDARKLRLDAGNCSLIDCSTTYPWAPRIWQGLRALGTYAISKIKNLEKVQAFRLKGNSWSTWYLWLVLDNGESSGKPLNIKNLQANSLQLLWSENCEVNSDHFHLDLIWSKWEYINFIWIFIFWCLLLTIKKYLNFLCTKCWELYKS